MTRWRAIWLSSVFPSPAHFFYPLRIVHIDVREILFYWPTYLSIGFFLAYFPFFHYVSYSILSSSSIFLSALSLVSSPFIVYFRCLLGDDFGNSWKDRSPNFQMDTLLNDQQDGRHNVFASTTTSSVGVIDSDESQHRFHGIELYRRSCPQVIFIKALILHRDIFPVPYLYELHCN